MTSFIRVDCVKCSSPEIGLGNCEFGCGKGFCKGCFEAAKQCAGCGLTGCDEHFDGMFCLECIALEEKERAAARN